MGHEWRRHISHRLLDSCLLQRLCGRRDPRLRGGNLSGHDYDAQIGHLDPSILPRESEARKPMAFATEGEAKQQRVEQQREQQRIRQSPVLRAHAVAVVRPWNPRNLVVLCGRCLDSAAGAGHDGKLRCASHQLTSPWVLALPNHVGDVCEPNPVHRDIHRCQMDPDSHMSDRAVNAPSDIARTQQQSNVD